MIGFWQHCRFLCRMMAPGMVAVLFVILSAVNFQIRGISVLMPLFPLMMVYYWAIYWPEVMPRWFVFLIGLFHDLLHMAPLGLSSLLLLLFWWVVTVQRRHLLKEPFIAIWLMFGLAGGLYFVAEWIGYALSSGRMFSGNALWMRPVLTVMLYPCIHRMLNRLHEAVLQK